MKPAASHSETHEDVQLQARCCGLFHTVAARTITTLERSNAPVSAARGLSREVARTRRTVQRGGRPAEDRLEERVTVRDHLGRLHSARVSIYEAGKLRTEAAALYLPAGLAGKAVSGTAAASLAVGAAGAAAMAGALGALGGGGGSSDAAGAGAVGYWHGPDGQVTFGVLKDPAALGLPRQQPVTRAALERAPLPPWQQQPLVAPPKARQQQQQQPPTANGKAAGPRSKSREP